MESEDKLALVKIMVWGCCAYYGFKFMVWTYQILGFY